MWKFLLPLLLCMGSLAAEYQVAAVSDNFVVHTANGEFAGQEIFISALNDRIDALQMSCGVYLQKPVQLYVVPNRAAYQGIARGKGAIVEFSDAFYTSEERRIYIRSSDQIWENYANVIIHEYVHWYLDEIMAEAPLWFHEGLATRFGNQLGIDRYFHYVRERFWGNRMDLFELAYEYPKEKADWEMYYLSSFFAVKYMQDRNENAWRSFWNEVAYSYQRGEKALFTSAFRKSYHADLYTFNQDFAAASRKQAWIYLAIGINSLLFAVLPFLVIYGVFRHRKKMLALPDLDLPEDVDEPFEEEIDEDVSQQDPPPRE